MLWVHFLRSAWTEREEIAYKWHPGVSAREIAGILPNSETFAVLVLEQANEMLRSVIREKGT